MAASKIAPRHSEAVVRAPNESYHDKDVDASGGDLNDLRLAIRALRAAPLVSAAAIVSLAIGIGANTAVFSVVNAILLRPAPYPEPDRLVLLGYTFSGASAALVSETKLNVWKDQTTAWQDIAAFRARDVNLSVGGRAERKRSRSKPMPTSSTSLMPGRLSDAPSCLRRIDLAAIVWSS
jgi:hypothetical protein